MKSNNNVAKLRILIADDFDEFRHSFGDALDAQRGISVVGSAKDGFEAVAMAKILKPDVVFLDISMPRMGGVEASMQIRTALPDAKIYFVTVHDEKTFEALSEVCEVDGYLSKNSLTDSLPRVIAGLRRPLKPIAGGAGTADRHRAGRHTVA